MKTGPSLEPLEARIAPAGIVEHFIDVDGDAVTVTISKGTPGQALFTLGLPNAIGGRQLQELELDPGGNFAGASITITAKPQTIAGVHYGDGLVNIGWIDASGFDLGSVSVRGDLGRVLAGTGSATAIKTLSIVSLGRLGLTTSAPDLTSTLAGGLGSLNVSSDIVGALVNVAGGAAGKIGSVNIGGSVIGGNTLYSGQVFCEGNMGTVKIGRDLEGGSAGGTGEIKSGGTMGNVSVGGSIFGGGNTPGDSEAGAIVSAFDLGAVTVGHDVKGGNGISSGLISSVAGKITSVNIGGSLIGGALSSSGQIKSFGNLGALTIGGSIQGGGSSSGFVSSGGTIGNISIGRSIVGGGDPMSGLIVSAGDIGTVKLGGDLLGGAGTRSGEIVSGRNLGAVTIVGSVKAGGSADTGKIDCDGTLAGVAIGGSLVGGAGDEDLNTDLNGIKHVGQIFSVGAMGMITIGHDVVGGDGYYAGTIHDDSGQLAGVIIGGSLTGGSKPVSGSIDAFGDLGAVKIGGDLAGGSDFKAGAIIGAGKVASVTVGGSLIGGSGSDYSGAIVSGLTLGPVKIGGNLHGGGQLDSGLIQSVADITSVSIAGSVLGGSLANAGLIFSGGKLGSITIGGSLVGGSNIGAGEVRSTGNLGTVKIIHDLINTGTQSGFIASDGRIASLEIGGSVLGGGSSVAIAAQGTLTPVKQADTVAIGSLTIGGRVEGVQIVAGYDHTITATDGDASIGTVKVAGDWIASDLLAGVKDGGDGAFGTVGGVNDDAVIATNNGTLLAKIASITIGGQVLGTAGGGSAHAFEAEQIGAFSVGGLAIPLSANAHNDDRAIGATLDVTIHEV